MYYFTILMCETQVLPSPLFSVSLVLKHSPPNTVSKIYISWRQKGTVCLADPKDWPSPFPFFPQPLYRGLLCIVDFCWRLEKNWRRITAQSISVERVFSSSGASACYHVAGSRSPFYATSLQVLSSLSSKYPWNFLLFELLGEATLIPTNLLGLFQLSWLKLIVSACGFL